MFDGRPTSLGLWDTGGSDFKTTTTLAGTTKTFAEMRG